MNDLLDKLFSEGTLLAATISAPRKRTLDGVHKIDVKPILLRGEHVYQFSAYYARKVTHENLPPDAAKERMHALLGDQFRHARFSTADADYDVNLNRRGEVAIRTLPASRTAPDLSHNRKKSYLLPEDTPVDFLIRLGVMSREGSVLAARYDKFRQINRFLEMVADIVDCLDPQAPLTVVDFGCGKAYLTFALTHYLHAVLKREARIVGVDVKADVIAQDNAIARDLGYDGLSFVVGDIRTYNEIERADMVVALHACDTATDDALAKAVAWGAQVILAAPCCQHELFGRIRSEVLHPLLKHGILKERLSALITDSLRANRLEIAGYTVRILEFIETEHTPKNLLIRAVRRDSPPNRSELVREYEAFRDFWHVQPYIEKILAGEPDSMSEPPLP